MDKEDAAMKPVLRKLLLGAGLLALPAAALAHTDVYLGLGLNGGYAPPPTVYYAPPPPPPPPVYYGPTVVYPDGDWRWREHREYEDWRWRQHEWHRHHHDDDDDD
jgi:hypothetical protein